MTLLFPCISLSEVNTFLIHLNTYFEFTDEIIIIGYQAFFYFLIGHIQLQIVQRELQLPVQNCLRFWYLFHLLLLNISIQFIRES